MASSIGLPSVTNFRDYRKFLKTYVEYRKRTGQYSLARFSEDVGFQSSNYASLIVSGKRNLTISDACRIAKFLKLRESETRYFVLLVQYDACDDAAERAMFRTWLEELSPKKKITTLRPTDYSSLLAEWYVPAVLSCLNPDKGCTVKTAARLTGLESRAVEASLASLVENGLARQSGGEYFLEIGEVTDAKFGIHHRFKEFQEAQLKASLQALRTSHRNTAKFSSNTFLVSQEAREALINRIRELIASVESHQAPNENATLMQLNLQVFEFPDGLETAR
jgi:uncharacterized protein (TIGR02147 family)